MFLHPAILNRFEVIVKDILFDGANSRLPAKLYFSRKSE
jgi:hypothetical protein